MLAFVRRRFSAATDALLFAVIVTFVAAGSGWSAVTEPAIASSQAALDQAGRGEQVLEGVLAIQPTGERADGTHWTATLETGGRTVTVRISHDDSHRTELMGAHVQVQGTWSADGTFVADAIDPVDPNAVAFGEESIAAPSLTVAAKGKQKTIEGVLSFRHGDDFANNRKTATRYFLTTATGDTELVFSRAPSAKLAGARVRVTGVADGKRLNVADGGTTQVAAATTVANTSSTGAHRVAVVLINFSNDSSQPYTPAFARGVAFDNTDSVAAYYAEGSWSQLTLSGDVFGWYTIPNTNANCAYSTWAGAATTAASAAGVDLSAYDNVVYAFPTTTCPWAGLGNMPGRSSWLNGTGAMGLRTMAHELGHNFGTHHASQLNCAEGGVQVSLSADMANCTSGEYGDPFSLMGMATRYEHTNFARGNFNWLTAGNTQTVAGSGDYLLAPVEIESSSTVSLIRVQRTASTWFNLEFRQPYGAYFETFPATAAVANGVTIRITPGYSTRLQSQLVDTTPGTTSFSDSPLGAGLSFIDPLTGVSITTISTSSAGAIVRISFGPGSPTPSPTPTTSPTPTPAPTPAPTPGPTPTPDPTPSPDPTATPTATPAPTATPIDTQPPTAPTNLKATIARSKRVALSWSASSDNVRVAGYRVYRDGTLVATVTNRKWTDSLTFVGGPRLYQVAAFDSMGNVSPASNVTLQ
jgi:hypothetical protein